MFVLLEKIKAFFSDIPVLKTDRLLLRQMHVWDAVDMYEYSCLPEVTRYLLWSPHPSLRHTKEYLEYLQTCYRTGGHYDWAIVLRDTGKMIGTCGFASFDKANNSAEIGYVLNPAYRHKGYALEAVRRVLQFGFGELLLNRIEGRFMEENLQSRRVMEGCGFAYEGLRRKAVMIKGNYETVGICAILKDEYEKQKSERR